MPEQPPPEARLAAATLAVTAGRPDPAPDAPLNPPVVLTSTYRASDEATRPGDRVYGRWDNPTWQALEETVGVLEGGRALAFAAGMATVAAVLDLVPVGGRVVLPNAPYSGTAQLVGRLASAGRLTGTAVDIADPAAVEAALPGADLLIAESPTNPLLDIADLPALAAAAAAAGAIFVVDNTFATPLLQRPLALGADVVLHSATKYLSGHSDVLLGMTVTARDDLATRLHDYRTLHGAIPGSWDAWLVLRGIRTLALRVERAGANAAELAVRLRDHPAVELVRHPSLRDDPGHLRAAAQMRGYGAIVRVDLRGRPAEAEAVCSAVRLWVHATSLGGVESTLERRRRHASESATVPQSLLRLSVGIEDVEDLWDDLDAALRAAGRPA